MGSVAIPLLTRKLAATVAALQLGTFVMIVGKRSSPIKNHAGRIRTVEYLVIDCRQLYVVGEEAITALIAEGWNPNVNEDGVVEEGRLYLAPQIARPNLDVFRKHAPALWGWLILEVTNEKQEVTWLHIHFDYGTG